MTNTDSIYAAINALRDEARASAGIPADYIAVAGGLDESDWVTDSTYSSTLGDPEADWCVDILPDDTVRVFAAGDIAAQRVIPGAASLIPAGDEA